VVGWAICAGLLAVSFPLHLLFEIPAGFAGEPTDWPAISWRVIMLLTATAVGALLLPRPGPHHRRPTFTRLPPWPQRAAYAGFLVPLLGWTVPHLVWFLGYPIGLSEASVAEAGELPATIQLAVTLAPTVGGLATLGLARRWGQVFPAWLPVIGRRRVPPLMAVVPAAVASYCLILYGGLGLGIIVSGLTTGAVTLEYLVESWLAALIEIVFVIWGMSVAVATIGYAKVTRCGVGVDT